MCLASAEVQRYKDEPGALREYNGHWCISRCPVCWIFAEKRIQDILSTGNTFEFGNVRLLQYMTVLGCLFAKNVLKRLALTAGGDEGHLLPPHFMNGTLHADI
jgi:hypothetical protein